MKPIRSLAAVLGLLSMTLGAGAQTPPKPPVTVDIKAQPMADALNQWAQQTGFQLIFPEERTTAGIVSGGVRGTYTPRAALDRLLRNSGLTYAYVNERTVEIRAAMSGPAADVPGDSRKTSAGAPALQMHLARVEEAREEQEQGDPGKPSQETDDTGGEKVGTAGMVVTGSRIATVASQLAANVIVLDAEALRTTGESTLEKALRQLPQNILGTSEIGTLVPSGGMSFNGALNITGGSNINLRGLGAESTLVLIDGRRIGKSGIFGGASDISGIPLSSVERVEIMLDGASSVYGSDAVGGVVNIILRKDYRGVEAGYEYGVPQEGGFDEHLVTFSGGHTWGRTRVRATFEHFQGEDLSAEDRPDRISSDRWDAPAGIQGNAGLFYAYQGQNYLPAQLTAMGLTTTSPGVQRIVYTQLPAGQDGSALDLADFEPLETLNLGPGYNDDLRLGVSLIPELKRSSLQLGFDHDFSLAGAPLTFSGNAYYSDRETYTGAGAFKLGFSLPASDPRSPFATTANFFWLLPSMGYQHYQTEQQVARGNLSLDGKLGAGWRWSVAAGHARDEIDSLNFNLADDFAAFFSDVNYLASDIVAANAPEELAALVAAPAPVAAVNEESVAELSAHGRLFALPGGEAHLAVGGEWREESLKSMSQGVTIAQTAGQFNASLAQGSYDSAVGRRQHSFFAELLLPLVSAANARRAVEQLTLTGSGRYDSYEVYGSSTTWSSGLIWSPWPQLRFKTNYSTSFVVPTPREGLAATRSFFSMPPFNARAIVDVFGVPTGELEYVGEQIIGGNPDLMPEHASSWSAGIEFRPQAIAGLLLGATWHRTDYRDRITAAPTPRYIAGTDYVAIYPNLTRREDGLLITDGRAINAASVETSGIDYQMRYDLDSRFGQFALAANIGYTHEYFVVPFAGTAPINHVKHVNGFNAYVYSLVPKYRYQGAVGWYRGGWAINLDATTTSDVSVAYRTVGQNLLTVSSTPLSADLLLSYDWDQAAVMPATRWLSGSRVSLRVLNVLDDHPQTRQIVVATGERFRPFFNANYADPRGRMFYVNLTKRF
jgi:outer membrane receptor protein involved in Fe transport